MSKKFKGTRLHKYRITLTLDMNEGEFSPHQIDWRKILSMESNEKYDAYVEDLDALPSWKS
jgi:hypothetical protein